jgi:pre-60S factor REI1
VDRLNGKNKSGRDLVAVHSHTLSHRHIPIYTAEGMSVFVESPEAACFKCNNCKASFTSIDANKEHYKCDWHVLNSKRRAQNLMPLTKEEFRKVGAKLIPRKKPASAPSVASSSGATPTSVKTVQGTRTLEPVQSALVPTEAVMVPDVEQEFEELEVDPLVSIFDNQRFDSPEACLAHMTAAYGFYIPDEKYVIDVSDLLEYLGSKVKTGGMCLYCHRQFRSAYACQNHMKDAGHCKVAYEEEDDVEELEEFYDYFEDEDGDSEEGEEQGEAHVSDIGELVLPDGRTVGHRAFQIYYKQRHRPVDDRPSVLAVEREQILRLGGIFGGSRVTNEELVKMSEGELRSLVMKFQKEERKGQVVEQRGRLRRLIMDQKREYRSTVDKARSSATTTAKIRDYHKTVM